MDVRRERPADYDAARAIHVAAFGPDSQEGALVDALRAEQAHVPDLCLVAEYAGRLVGHVFYSRATLASGDEVLALAPMAVLPDHQRSGVGGRLIRESLALAEPTAFPLVVVLGHAAYYPRFGFEPAAGFGIECPWPVPPEAWMAKALSTYHSSARGMVTYAAPFAAVT